tara:strand:+ start:14013 stop:14921 length:909 start_codon:yes stop_codon:yes gene_type:complete
MEVDTTAPESFHVTFDCTSSLRTLLQTLHSIFDHQGVEFKLEPAEDSQDAWLKVEAIDSSQVCIVKSKLRCRVVSLIGSPHFTVYADVLNTCLRSVPTHYSLDLIAMPGETHVNMKLYETISQSHTVNFKCTTILSSEKELPSFNDIFYNYTLEFDAPTLRNCVRSCKDTGAKDIVFTVSMPHQPASHNGAQSTSHMIVSICAEGDYISQERLFHSIVDTTRTSQSIIITDHDEDIGNEHGVLEEKYRGRFSLNFLAFFLKSIEKHHLTARLEKNKPLVLSYPLGSDDSFIFLILAPKLDED